MSDEKSLSDEAFLQHLYVRVLGRTPDPDGAEYFLAQLAAGADRSQIVAALESSDEATAPRSTVSVVEGEMLVIEPRNAHYDDWTSAIIKRVLRPDSVAIDVGAHVGDVLANIVAAAPTARHLAFEPIPELAEIVRQRFPHVQVFETALSDRDGSSTFQYVVTNPAYSGLLRRRYDRPDETVREITVKTTRLDDLTTDIDVRFIKIDVEGGELQVLRGATDLLARCRPVVVFEHGLGAADHYGTGPTDVWSLLTAAGLEISLLDSWLEGLPTLDLAGFVRQFETNENYYFIAHPR